jgi:putative oxygen-independent coproporphyrinogen III oxidase
MTQPFGIYVHVPFCRQRCDYCAFVTSVGRDDLHEAYVASLIAELEHFEAPGPAPASSLYVGGGTPSRVAPELLGSLISRVDLVSGAEVTVEVNPEDASVGYLDALARVGVNRVSMGIQSVVGHVLASLGRPSVDVSPQDLLARVEEAGIERCSMDLILGGFGERDEDVVATLEAMTKGPRRVSHVSCYLLTVEKGTPLSKDPARHPDDDVLAARYELVDNYLSDAGYGWYEISNWSLPGCEARHNQLYWTGGNYLGLGVGAHSHLDGTRWWNVANLETYLERVASSGTALLGSETLDGPERAFESLGLALRLATGIDPIDGVELRAFDGLLEERDGRWILTQRGRLLASEVTVRLSHAAIQS